MHKFSTAAMKSSGLLHRPRDPQAGAPGPQAGAPDLLSASFHRYGGVRGGRSLTLTEYLSPLCHSFGDRIFGGKVDFPLGRRYLYHDRGCQPAGDGRFRRSDRVPSPLPLGATGRRGLGRTCGSYAKVWFQLACQPSTGGLCAGDRQAWSHSWFFSDEREAQGPGHRSPHPQVVWTVWPLLRSGPVCQPDGSKDGTGRGGREADSL